MKLAKLSSRLSPKAARTAKTATFQACQPPSPNRRGVDTLSAGDPGRAGERPENR